MEMFNFSAERVTKSVEESCTRTCLCVNACAYKPFVIATLMTGYIYHIYIYIYIFFLNILLAKGLSLRGSALRWRRLNLARGVDYCSRRLNPTIQSINQHGGFQ